MYAAIYEMGQSNGTPEHGYVSTNIWHAILFRNFFTQNKTIIHEP
jgi:hypothetical protein